MLYIVLFFKINYHI